MSEPPDQALVARGYAEADRDFRVHQAWIGCVLVLVCMPLGAALDWFVYPRHLGTIFARRLVCDLAVLPIFALPFALGALLVATHGRPSSRLLALVLLLIVCARTAARLFDPTVSWARCQRKPPTAAPE